MFSPNVYRPFLLFLLAALFWAGYAPAFAQSEGKSFSNSARERFYRKYGRPPPTRVPQVPESTLKGNLRERRQKLMENRREMEMRQKQKREVRKDKIEHQKEVLEGKAAAKEKKEAVRLKARREEITQRTEEKRLEEKKLTEQRHEEIMDRARKHRLEMKQRQEEYRARRTEREYENSRRLKDQGEQTLPSLGLGGTSTPPAAGPQGIGGVTITPGPEATPPPSQHLSGSGRSYTVPHPHISGN